MSTLQWRYGGFTHPANEVYPRAIEARPLVTNDGIRWGTALRYEIAGDLCADPSTPLDLAGVNTRVAQLENAYKNDYQDFGFLIDGAPSNHYVLTNDPENLSGNKVLSRGFPHRGPNELANNRSFTVTLGATFQEAYSQILLYSERVSQRGTGGTRWTLRPRFSGIPERTDIHDNTRIEMIQQGVIIGLNARPQPPAPYWPSDEVEEDRYVEQFSPRFHGHLNFDRPTHFELRYRYRFLFAQLPSATNFVQSRHGAPFGHGEPFGY